jgi:hypothetical protein
MQQTIALFQRLITLPSNKRSKPAFSVNAARESKPMFV